MKEELITLELAVLANEKGFHICCKDSYEEGIIYENEDFPYNSFTASIFAPTQSLLQQWLREIHNIHIEIYYMDDLLKYGYQLTNVLNNKEYLENYEFSKEKDEQGFIKGFCYEKCLQTGLTHSLNLL